MSGFPLILRTLGQYLLRGRVHAILGICALTLASVMAWPLSYFISGSSIGLVTLRKGALAGAQVAAGCLLLFILLALAFNLDPNIPLAYAAFVWLPALVCATALRHTESQGLAVSCAGLLGMAFVVWLHHSALEQALDAWHRLFVRWRGFAQNEPEILQQLEQVEIMMEPLISLFLTTGLVCYMIGAMLLARWWQSILFNPGGFRPEFYALRLPRWFIYPTLLSLVLLLFVANLAPPIVRDALALTLLLYMFQGVSAMHGYIHARGFSRIWLIAMYTLFFLIPHAILLFMSCVGIANACRGGKVAARSGAGKNP